MTLRAVVLDIGGVLEMTPRTGWQQKWDARLPVNELEARLQRMGRDGSLGTCPEAEWQAGVLEITGMESAQMDEFMADLWHEYLGTLNTELAAYFTSLRPRYNTALLSNSFLGAPGKEEERYHLSTMTDLIVYSHEEAVAKPDPRIYERTAERLGVPYGEMAFVDDLEPNIAAACDLGIHALPFKNTEQAVVEACLSTGH